MSGKLNFTSYGVIYKLIIRVYKLWNYVTFHRQWSSQAKSKNPEHFPKVKVRLKNMIYLFGIRLAKESPYTNLTFSLVCVREFLERLSLFVNYDYTQLFLIFLAYSYSLILT